MDKLFGSGADMAIVGGALRAHAEATAATTFNIATASVGTSGRVRVNYADGFNGEGVVAKPEVDRDKFMGDLADDARGLASGAGIVREFARLVVVQTSFEAAAAAIKTFDDTFGTLINTKA